MGRGRAKAKQTKVARELKYQTHETDFASLAQELHGSESTRPVERVERVDPVDDSDGHDKWSDHPDTSSRD